MQHAVLCVSHLLCQPQVSYICIAQEPTRHTALLLPQPQQRMQSSAAIVVQLQHLNLLQHSSGADVRQKQDALHCGVIKMA